MDKKQFYGLKYPFTAQDAENYFIDLNYDMKEYARSALMHLVFTPKGQKLRDPQFGTDLIRYVFEPSTELSWNEIRGDVNDTVKKFLPFITINDINVLENEDNGREIFVRLDYTVSSRMGSFKDSLVAPL